jgi:hypothetical protein
MIRIVKILTILFIFFGLLFIGFCVGTPERRSALQNEAQRQCEAQIATAPRNPTWINYLQTLSNLGRVNGTTQEVRVVAYARYNIECIEKCSTVTLTCNVVEVRDDK